MRSSAERVGGPRRTRVGTPRRMTLVVILGFAVCAAVWVVAGTVAQQIAERHGPGPGPALLVALSLVVGSVGLVPAGALTDRYGARLVLTGITGFAAVSMLLATVGTAVTRMIAVVIASCLVGTAFSVGASVVARYGRPNRRGLGLSVFGAGIAGAAVTAVLLRPEAATVAPRALAVLASALLVAYAGIAVVGLRDTPVPARNVPLRQDIVSILRMQVTRQWCVLYAVACGPLVAMLFYLPLYAPGPHHRPWGDATIITATLIALTAAARPAGGWLASAAKAPSVLVTCYVMMGGLGVVVALEPPEAVVLSSLVLIAGASGTAGGVLLCRIGRAVPPERAGLIIGVVGAVAAIIGLLPPALLYAAHEVHGQHTIAIMLLSAASIATATYARRRRDWVNPLAFPLLHTSPVVLEPAEFQSTGTTVVALAASDTGPDRPVVLAILTELATRHELIVVYGPDSQPPADTLTPAQLVAAIRDRLPRYKVAAILMDADSPADSPEWAIVTSLLADGAIAVAVVDAPDLTAAAENIGRRLNVNVVRLQTGDPAEGVQLQPLPTVTTDMVVARPRTSLR